VPAIRKCEHCLSEAINTKQYKFIIKKKIHWSSTHKPRSVVVANMFYTGSIPWTSFTSVHPVKTSTSRQ
jgi:hypothetical protein